MNTLSSLLKNLRNRTPVGSIQMYGGDNPPTDWLVCDGATKNIADYPKLYEVLGTTYGGNGTTTFKLPDMRGRMAIGVGDGTATGHTEHSLGEAKGNEDLVVPYHRHSVAAVTNGITGGSHTHTVTAVHYDGDLPTTNVNMSSGGKFKNESLTTNARTHTHDLPSHNTNYTPSTDNRTGANMPPYLCVNYIIYAGKTVSA